jgi:hypothetical protein
MTMTFFAVAVLSLLAGAMWGVSGVKLKRAVVVRRAAGALLVMTVFAPALAMAHGNVALEDDICVRRVGGSMVHFNAYQPHIEAKAQYCTEIPGEGDTFLVVDLVDPTLRTLPVGVRVVRGSEESSEDQTVAYWPPATHPDGILRGEAMLTKGLYKLIITAEGLSPSSYLLRVQQVDYGKVARKVLGPLTVLLVLGLIGYEFSKSRQLRKWRASGQS